MNFNVLEITPQTGAYTGGQLYQAVDQHADGQQRQAKVDQRPQHRHAGQARFRYAVAHDGLYRVAGKEFFPHGCMVTKTRLAA